MHSDNFRTVIKGSGLEGEFMVNKNGRVLPRPGSLAATNVLESSQNAQLSYTNNQRSQGNTQGYSAQAPTVQTGNLFRNNPVYGPAQSSYVPRPRSGFQPTTANMRFPHPPPTASAPSYASAVSQTQTNSQNANPLAQFMFQS